MPNRRTARARWTSASWLTLLPSASVGFQLEVLETVAQTNAEDLRVEMAALESLWRERLEPDGLY